MDAKDFLEVLCNEDTVSGHESRLNNSISTAFRKYSDEISIDDLGNIIILKKGKNTGSNPKIMIAAHVDEIGLMVKYIEKNGFLRFTNIGGVDPRTIVGQEVTVHGSKDLFGVVSSKPPHLQEASETEKAIKMEDMFIDVGYSKEDLADIVNIGDVITVKRDLGILQNNRFTGRALDNKTGITAMYECAKELSRIEHEADVYFVCTVQEEVGMAGGITSSYNINPDIAIALDVGFGYTPELPKTSTVKLGEGPGLTLGGNIHPSLRKQALEVAKEYNIPFQTLVMPGNTMTDAWVIQIARAGIPAICLFIPLRYMHTSVEVVDMSEIKNVGKLSAFFIASISNENLEGLLCY